jgi:hypothetical protein
MTGRALEFLPASADAQTPRRADIVLRTPPNWTAVWFFAVLGTVHFCMAIPAYLHHRMGGHMSLIFGSAFVLAALVSYLVCIEIAVLPGERRIRLRSGYRRLNYERSVPFRNVLAVRVTTGRAPDYPIARVDVVCRGEDIECPPTACAGPQGLFLAIAMNVRLIKVSGEEEPQRSGRMDERVDSRG